MYSLITAKNCTSIHYATLKKGEHEYERAILQAALDGKLSVELPCFNQASADRWAISLRRRGFITTVVWHYGEWKVLVEWPCSYWWLESFQTNGRSDLDPKNYERER